MDCPPWGCPRRQIANPGGPTFGRHYDLGARALLCQCVRSVHALQRAKHEPFRVGPASLSSRVDTASILLARPQSHRDHAARDHDHDHVLHLRLTKLVLVGYLATGRCCLSTHAWCTGHSSRLSD